MNNWKILICDGLAESGQTILQDAAQVDDRSGISAAELLDVAGQYDALIVRSRTKVTAAVFAATSNLKVVGRAGVGVDSIDLEAAKAHGVMVVNSPMATSLAVAEHTFGLMLSLARHIPRADASMKAGEWAKKQLGGSELHGKTLGIVGMGRIGSELGRRAAAFGMAILGYDPFLSDEAIRERGAEAVELAVLYGRSHYISLHVPLSNDTRNMIDKAALQQMMPGTHLICAARGGVINEEDLLAALQSGHIAGAALDVFAQEPPGATALVTHPLVVATPHIAAQTAESQTRAAEHIATEVLAALAGDELRWRVV
jgi:D-3-phosphoglycerate dehydrogenase